ncbi:hypothetical protein INN71_13310 [Nocardioides sp. ChNu-153]|uniref:hypothetical protein n=1 Tax=unclassified Nocardioides TaxID=2615069 RepID=UPI002406C032|nr:MULTISPECIES: hypothetical protein [unclassified Nocardioides]MDF9715098.1 hypothetical protein [Nocardioides sp. ChNu-99]MDN7122368.1 hypothetical protein [Nocardioides sp. ChNu-153]
MSADAPRFPVLEAADGYDIAAVDRHVATLLDDVQRGRRTGFHPGPLDTRPFALVHRSQVYDARAVDAWFDRCSGELEARRHHPSGLGRATYDGDLDDPPELRDVPASQPATDDHTSTIPTWARIVALLVIVALLGSYVLSFF